MKSTIHLKKKIGKYTIESNAILDFDDAVKYINHTDFISMQNHHHEVSPNLNSKFNGHDRNDRREFNNVQ
jgi:hypothetical protein